MIFKNRNSTPVGDTAEEDVGANRFKHIEEQGDWCVLGVFVFSTKGCLYVRESLFQRFCVFFLDVKYLYLLFVQQSVN